MDADGKAKADEAIMIGKETAGDIPKTYTNAILGAYIPTPEAWKAPKATFTKTAMMSLIPSKPIAVPTPNSFIQPI